MLDSPQGMTLTERAWLRQALQDQINLASKELVEICSFLLTRPDDPHARNYFVPLARDHTRIIQNCQRALAYRRPKRRLKLYFPLQGPNHMEHLTSLPPALPIYHGIISLILEVYSIDPSSDDWRASFPSFPNLKHLTLVATNPRALSIARWCLEVCPRMSYLTLLWADFLDWDREGPQDQYFVELKKTLESSLGKLKKLELDAIIYKRLIEDWGYEDPGTAEPEQAREDKERGKEEARKRK